MRRITAALVAGMLGCSSGGGGGASATDTSSGAGTDNGIGTDNGTGTGGGDQGASQPAEGTVRIYVAGESIERRNRFVEAPFKPDGTLNERGGGDLRNDDDEYGWSIPLADRLKLRFPGIEVEFAGTDTWLDAEDNPFSGTYPSSVPSASSAISGTDIPTWLEQRRGELESKAHCYDLAFAARGGNDYGSDDTAYVQALVDLVVLLSNGSSCRPDPAVYVTAHVPDNQCGCEGDLTEYVTLQKQDFVERAKAAVERVRSESPEIRVHFVDQYTPFLENRATTAFPAEIWSTDGIPDYEKILRVGDPLHIRRLSSIYIGEIAADAVDLSELGFTR